MSHSLQLFIYKTPGINGDNNYPLFRFATKAEAYNFISQLVSVPKPDNGEYMVLNNPQLLPDNIRNLHMYPSGIIEDDSSDEEFGKTRLLDGYFNICDNIELLRAYSANIDDNTNCNVGFSDYLCNPQ